MGRLKKDRAKFVGGFYIKKPKMDWQLYAEICTAWNKGASVAEITRQTKKNYPFIRQILIDAGYELEKRNAGISHKPRKKGANRKKVVRLVSNGRTPMQVARALGISKQRVYQILKEEK